MKLFKNSLTILLQVTLVVLISSLIMAFQVLSLKEDQINSTSLSPVGVNDRFSVDLNESLVKWRGSMAFAPKVEHLGYVKLLQGELMVNKDKLVGGAVVIDMNSIADKVHGTDNGLVSHLKDADFFDVKKFPESTFIITHVGAWSDGKNIQVTGDLTIKGITNAVTFPASFQVKNGVAQASGKLTIDRTKWDIKYKSGKFFDGLADEAISDDIEFEMNIMARK